MGFTLKPVQGKALVNREKIIEEMVTSLADFGVEMGFALVGNRRMGKTSIFLEVCRQLRNKEKIVPVYFSLWDLVEGTLEEFTQFLSVAILDAYKDRLSLKLKAKNFLKIPLETIKEILTEAEVAIKIKEEVEILLSPRRAKKRAIEDLERVFELPESLALQTKTRCVLFLDEFPSIIELKDGAHIGEGAIRKIRTIHERQRGTILSISGSIRKTMEIVALSSASAFYRQLIVREIGPWNKEDIKDLIMDNLKKPIGEEALEKIVEFTSGIPFYAQFLGRELSGVKEKELTAQSVDVAIEQFIEEEGSILFKEEFERLGPKERKIVTLMASQDLSSPSQIARAMGQTPNKISMYLEYLEEKGVIEKIERGTYGLADPVFKRWLAIKYA
ncbi:ATP-binding protein [candidate division TA06 bacterium]|nr:ATP-binding protein [candidate division TA06 bacterium]